MSDRAKAPPGQEKRPQLHPEEEKELKSVGAVIHESGEAAPGMMKIDLHCHTEASYDCTTPLDAIVERCREQEVVVQAITDHNEIWGALELQALLAVQRNGGNSELAELTLIVGEEITTSEGEIIGLFLTEKIEAGMTPEETVRQIKTQGGLVLLPHGFDPLKRWRLKPEARQRIAHEIDVVETFNARISRPRWNRAGVIWAEERGLCLSAGSDAHTLSDIGSAWVEVKRQRVGDPAELLAALKGGTPVGRWTHPAIAFGYKMWDQTRRKVARNLALRS
jgi:predicted metal-dependent phosphoesterase TrpH